MHTIERAFIRSRDGIPFSQSSYIIWQGMTEKGIETTFFTDLDTEVLPHISPSTLVHSGVGDVRRAIAYLHYHRKPDLPSAPECLAPFFGRTMRRGTMKDVRDASSWPTFVKPVVDKLFTGYVIREFKDLIRSAHLSDDAPAFISDPVEFITEYRCFMHWDKVIGVRNYAGDPLVFPDLETVHNASAQLLRQHSGLPTAYSIDIGVLSDGRTVIVEVNDAYSLSPYGLHWFQYVPMIEDRWLELTAEPNAFARELVCRFLDRRITMEQFLNRFPIAVDRNFSDALVDSAHLVWREYTAWEDAPSGWLYMALKERVGPLRSKFGA